MSDIEATAPAADEDTRVPSETGVADDAGTGDQQIGPEDGEDGEQAPPPKTYRVKAAGQELEVTEEELINGFQLNADYTKGKQKLSERERELEARQAEVDQRAQAQQEYLDDVADLRTVSKQVEAYANVDWAALRAQDPDAAQEHFFTYQQLRDQRDELQRGLQTKIQQRTAEQQRTARERFEAGRAELAKIPGWNEETERKVADFGRGEGFNQQELAQTVLDPRLGKILHKAFLWDQHAKQQAKAKTVQRQAEAPAPAPKVGGHAGAGRKSILDKAKDGDVAAVRARLAELNGR